MRWHLSCGCGEDTLLFLSRRFRFTILAGSLSNRGSPDSRLSLYPFYVIDTSIPLYWYY